MDLTLRFLPGIILLSIWFPFSNCGFTENPLLMAPHPYSSCVFITYLYLCCGERGGRPHSKEIHASSNRKCFSHHIFHWLYNTKNTKILGARLLEKYSDTDKTPILTFLPSSTKSTINVKDCVTRIVKGTNIGWRSRKLKCSSGEKTRMLGVGQIGCSSVGLVKTSWERVQW